MASSIHTSRTPSSSGRGFASVDPERQREVAGYVRSGPIQTAQPTRTAGDRAARTARSDWMRVQPERDASFEGSSSRRSR